MFGRKIVTRKSKLSILHEAIQELIQDSGLEERQILSLYWNRHFTPLARHAVLDDLHQGRLKILVDSSLWLHQLHLQKESIRKALNKKVKKELIKEINLRIGNIQRRSE